MSALIDEPTFAPAQELLQENKVRARRRTIEPSLVQGLVSCRKCGYALWLWCMNAQVGRLGVPCGGGSDAMASTKSSRVNPNSLW